MTQIQQAEVICLGILVADVIGRPIDSVPPPGTLQLVPSITPHIGGCAANTGIGLQTLGVDTKVIGKVGKDGFGAFIETELEARGVTAHVIEDDVVPTSATMVLVSSDAERAFLHCTGANATLSLEDIDLGELEGAKLLHIAGHGLTPKFDGDQAADLLRHSQARGIKTSLDTAGAPNDVWVSNLRKCLPYLNYFVPSLHEVQHLCPELSDPAEIGQYLLDAGVDVVALKMGEKGSYVTDGTQAFLVARFQVDAVDATGAGDAFAAGFLCGLLRGYGLEQAARLGNAAGALCVTEVGTVAGYRSLEDTLLFIDSHSQPS